MAERTSTASDSVNSSPLFETPDGWSPGYALAKGHGPGVVVGPGLDNPNLFGQFFSTKPHRQFKVIARASSIDKPAAPAVIQINWHDADGKFISVSRQSFDVGPAERSFRYDVIAPPGAASGTLYVMPGAEKEAVRYTEMTLARLDPIHDFMSYRLLGIKVHIVASVTAIILVLALLYARYGVKLLHGSTLLAGGAAAAIVRSFPPIAIVLCVAMFIFMEGNYEQHYDSHWHQSSIDSIMQWNTFSLDFGGNLLYNFGIQHVINPQLSPTFWIGSIVPQDYRIQVEAAFQALVFFAIFVQLCRFAGARLPHASAISLIAVYYAWVPLLSNEYITLSPTLGLLWQEGAIATLLAFLCFTLVGYKAGKGPARAWPIIGFVLSVLWLYLAYPETIPFFTIATAALCVGATLGVNDWRELYYKAAAAVGLAVVFLALRVDSYVVNLFQYTPQMYYHTPFAIDFGATSLLTMWLYYGFGGMKVVAFLTFALIGAIVALYVGNSFARRVVLGALALELLIHLLSAANVWLKLAPLSFAYVEQMGIVVVALLAGTGVWSLIQLAFNAIERGLIAVKRLGRDPPLLAATTSNALQALPYVLLYFFVATVLWQLSRQTGFYTGWPPQTDSDPAQIQIRELAVKPGGAFKGRAAVLLEMNKERPIVWGPDFFPILYYKYRVAFGNDFLIDAENVGAPIVNEYGHWISPSMLALLAAGFYRPEDHIGRAAQVPRAFRPQLARLMGVSLVVSDQPLPGEVELFRGLATDHPVYIHRIVGANLGGYSPTRTVIANSAERILDHLQVSGFDGKDLAIVEEPIKAALSPAENVSMTFERGPRLHITAYSNGTSLLVLPIDYSHCLEVRGEGWDKLIPVNLAQTGLIVRGRVSVEISYRYGLLKGTECRKHDLDRVRRLRLAEAATGRLFYDARPVRGAAASRD